MNVPYLDTSANYPIENSPSGFEATALLRLWNNQLGALLSAPGVNLAEINACILRLAQIANEATENSKPKDYSYDTQENEIERTQTH